MKILVLGCNGMLGHMVSLYFKEQGHEAIGFARKKSQYVDTIVGDAYNASLLKAILEQENFHAIINCIGILNNDAEENKSKAVYLNAFLPHYLCDITAQRATKVIHISTDCVFSGKRGQYTEDDYCDGETFYARSKALGEIRDNKNLTIRTSIVGPDLNPNGIGLLNWFMHQEHAVKGYVNVLWNGQTTLQLAKTIEQAIVSDLTGLYNIVPQCSISKYQLLSLFNQYLRSKKIIICPSRDIVSDKTLKTNCKLSYQLPSYEVMIQNLKKWIDRHKALYEYYINQ